MSVSFAVLSFPPQPATKQVPTIAPQAIVAIDFDLILSSFSTVVAGPRGIDDRSIRLT
jgi:hypothetical protein